MNVQNSTNAQVYNNAKQKQSFKKLDLGSVKKIIAEELIATKATAPQEAGRINKGFQIIKNMGEDKLVLLKETEDNGVLQMKSLIDNNSIKLADKVEIKCFDDLVQACKVGLDTSLDMSKKAYEDLKKLIPTFAKGENSSIELRQPSVDRILSTIERNRDTAYQKAFPLQLKTITDFSENDFVRIGDYLSEPTQMAMTKKPGNGSLDVLNVGKKEIAGIQDFTEFCQLGLAEARKMGDAAISDAIKFFS